MLTTLSRGRRTSTSELYPALRAVADRLPAVPDGKHWFTLADRDNWTKRTVHDIQLVTDRIGTTGQVCDIGGGFGLFAIGCAMLGMRPVLVEDFFDIERLGMLDATMALLDEYGVEARRRDIATEGLGFERDSIDAAVCFHVLEHLPLSPRPTFREMREAVGADGVIVIAGPNAANLRKRVGMPLGKIGWSPMAEWYESEHFRGHVREPLARDMEYIARDLDLTNVRVTGANFLGLANPDPRKKRVANLADPILRRRPSLCSDLYMTGQVAHDRS